uniref:Translation initiation factor IF-2 n=1 Tax=Parastrongyloides trichosuri TaxID=131310 RepID=A0A0N5A4P0_PARTI
MVRGSGDGDCRRLRPLQPDAAAHRRRAGHHQPAGPDQHHRPGARARADGTPGHLSPPGADQHRGPGPGPRTDGAGPRPGPRTDGAPGHLPAGNGHGGHSGDTEHPLPDPQRLQPGDGHLHRRHGHLLRPPAGGRTDGPGAREPARRRRTRPVAHHHRPGRSPDVDGRSQALRRQDGARGPARLAARRRLSDARRRAAGHAAGPGDLSAHGPGLDHRPADADRARSGRRAGARQHPGGRGLYPAGGRGPDRAHRRPGPDGRGSGPGARGQPQRPGRAGRRCGHGRDRPGAASGRGQPRRPRGGPRHRPDAGGREQPHRGPGRRRTAGTDQRQPAARHRGRAGAEPQRP